MLIKVLTCGVDGYDSLVPFDEDDFSVNLHRLPRGYLLETDEAGVPYILCPNKEKVYDFDKTRSRAESVKFSYMADGRKRTVRLHIDTEATNEMLFSVEPYRQFP